MSCPYTSPQKGKAEHIHHSTNNIIRSLLFQAAIPPSYWVEALRTATYLLNILTTKTLKFSTPHATLFGIAPSYDHLRVFGCKCYPNLSATAPHKLARRSTMCLLLGYSAHHKEYCCLDTLSNRVIISHHVTFDRSTFPSPSSKTPPHHTHTAAAFYFLDDLSNPMPAPTGPTLPLISAGLCGAWRSPCSIAGFSSRRH